MNTAINLTSCSSINKDFLYEQLNRRYQSPDVLLQTCLTTSDDFGNKIELDRTDCKLTDKFSHQQSPFLVKDKKIGLKQDIKLTKSGQFQLNKCKNVKGKFDFTIDDFEEIFCGEKCSNNQLEALDVFSTNYLNCFKINTFEYGLAVCIVAYLFSKIIHPILWNCDSQIYQEVHYLAHDFYLKSLSNFYEMTLNVNFLKSQLKLNDFLKYYCIHNFKIEYQVYNIHTIGQIGSIDRRIYNLDRALTDFFRNTTKIACIFETKLLAILIWRNNFNNFFILDPFDNVDGRFLRTTNNFEQMLQLLKNETSIASSKTNENSWFSITEIVLKSTDLDCNCDERQKYQIDVTKDVYQLVLPNEAILIGGRNFQFATPSVVVALVTLLYINWGQNESNLWKSNDIDFILKCSQSLVDQNLEIVFMDISQVPLTLNFTEKRRHYRIEYDFVKSKRNRIFLTSGLLLREDQFLTKFKKLFEFSSYGVIEVTITGDGDGGSNFEYFAIWKQNGYYFLHKKRHITMTTDIKNIAIHILSEFDRKPYKLYAINVKVDVKKIIDDDSIFFDDNSSIFDLDKDGPIDDDLDQSINLDAPYLSDTQILGSHLNLMNTRKMSRRLSSSRRESSLVSVYCLTRPDYDKFTMTSSIELDEDNKMYENRMIVDMLELTKNAIMCADQDPNLDQGQVDDVECESDSKGVREESATPIEENLQSTPHSNLNVPAVHVQPSSFTAQNSIDKNVPGSSRDYSNEVIRGKPTDISSKKPNSEEIGSKSQVNDNAEDKQLENKNLLESTKRLGDKKISDSRSSTRSMSEDLSILEERKKPESRRMSAVDKTNVLEGNTNESDDKKGSENKSGKKIGNVGTTKSKETNNELLKKKTVGKKKKNLNDNTNDETQDDDNSSDSYDENFQDAVEEIVDDKSSKRSVISSKNGQKQDVSDRKVGAVDKPLISISNSNMADDSESLIKNISNKSALIDVEEKKSNNKSYLTNGGSSRVHNNEKNDQKKPTTSSNMDFKGAAKDYNEVVDEKEDEEEESTQDFDVDEIAEIDKSDKSDSIRTESSKKNINDNSNERQDRINNKKENHPDEHQPSTKQPHDIDNRKSKTNDKATKQSRTELIESTDEILDVLNEIISKAVTLATDISYKNADADSNRKENTFWIEEKIAIPIEVGHSLASDQISDISEQTPIPSYLEEVIESKNVDIFMKSAASTSSTGIIKDPIIPIKIKTTIGKKSECDCLQSIDVEKKFIKLPDGVGVIVTPIDICISSHVEGRQSRFVSIMALLYATKYPMVVWTKNLICNVLNSGYQLNSWLMTYKKHLYEHCCIRFPVYFAKDGLRVGTRVECLQSTTKLSSSLIEKLLFDRTHYPYRIGGMIESSRYTCAVLRTRKRFYMFDSSGCDHIGLALNKHQKSDKSIIKYCCLLRFKDLNQMIRRIVHNALQQEGYDDIFAECLGHPVIEFVISSVDLCRFTDPIELNLYSKEFSTSKYDLTSSKMSCVTNTIQGHSALHGRFVLTYYLKQCHFCCIIAIFALRLYPLSEWTSEIVDRVLRDGINLYNRTRDRYVQDERIFRNILIQNRTILVEEAKMIRIPLKSETRKISFGNQLKLTLNELGTILIQFQSSSFVVSKVSNKDNESDDGNVNNNSKKCLCYYLFDPYPCGQDGRRDNSERGNCGWTRFDNFRELQRRILFNICNSCDWYCFYKIDVVSMTISTIPSAVISTKISCDKNVFGKSEQNRYLKSVTDRVPWSRINVKNMDNIARNNRVAKELNSDWSIELKNDLWSLWSSQNSEFSMRYPILDEKWILSNCIVALILSTKYDLFQWNPKILDTIMLYGKAYLYHNDDLKNTSGFEVSNYEKYDWCLYPFQCTIHIKGIVEGEIIPSGCKGKLGLLDAMKYFFEKMDHKLCILVHQFIEIANNYDHPESKPNQIRKKIYLALGKCQNEYFLYDCQSFSEPIYVKGTGGAYVLRCRNLNRLINCVWLMLKKTGTFYLYEVIVKKMLNKFDENYKNQISYLDIFKDL